MYLLDTNHCSLILLNDQRIIQRIQQVGEANVATTIITAGELIYMAENSAYRKQNLNQIYHFLEDIRVYDLDKNSSKIYGKIKADLIKQFGPKEKIKRKTTQTKELGFDENDIWIAAIAIRHRLTLVSADTDFSRIKTVSDFSLENWRDN